MNEPWHPEFWPEALWHLGTNLGLLVAFGAFVTFLGWLWHTGPDKLIKYGPQWATRLGLYWDDRRKHEPIDGAEGEDGEADSG